MLGEENTKRNSCCDARNARLVTSAAMKISRSDPMRAQWEGLQVGEGAFHQFASCAVARNIMDRL